MSAAVAPPGRAGRWPWPIRALLWLVLGLVAAAGAIMLGIDSDAGHRLLVNEIAGAKIKSGLRIRIGRIDGSIWRHARIRDLRLYDTRGLFLQAPNVALDWHPLHWFRNQLTVDRLAADTVLFDRLPVLRPSANNGPLLPSFDIHLGTLSIARLRVGAAIAGQPRVGLVQGSADIARGRATIHVTVAAGHGDRAQFALDAVPAADRFDLAAQLRSPHMGLVSGLLGTRDALALDVTGKGDWRAWRGTAAFDLAGRHALALQLAADNGRYRLAGFAAPAPFTSGKVARLTAPRIGIAGAATYADRQVDGQVRLTSPALALIASGRIDLATSSFAPVTLDARLLRPAALFPNMTGQNIRLQAHLAGPFKTARFDYRLTSPHLAFDQTGFDDVLATGSSRWSRPPIILPLRLSARRVTGVGDVAGGILANLQVIGPLRVTAAALDGSGLQLSSDKLRGTLGLHVDLVSGDYNVALTGALTRYLIPGLGIVDVSTKVAVVPGPGGRGTQVAGRGQAWVRRFDNAFLSSLAGGLPQIDTALVRTPDSVVHFHGLKLTAPAISITGDGDRAPDGSFHFTGHGTQASYGPFAIVLDGQIDHPRVELTLDHPVPALGLSAVSLLLDPTPQGYLFKASGGSRLGPFAAHGTILLPPGAPAVVQVADLAVAGTHLHGDLRSDPGGFTGTLHVAGGGFAGSLAFAPAGTIQRIEAHLALAGATIPGGSAITVRRGRIDGGLLLDSAGLTLDGKAQAMGLRRGGIFLARSNVVATLKHGEGQVAADLAGSRGRGFALHLTAAVSSGSVRVTGTGSVDRQPITLTGPAVLQADGGGYKLSAATISYAGGSAAIGGRFGTAADGATIALDRLPLSVLDLLYPGLGLGGSASGKLVYAVGNGAPGGRVDLTVRGLTRAGLVLSSQPVDLGLAAQLDGRGAAMRAVVVSAGTVIGRAQGRVAPLGGAGSFVDRLLAAPLFAQLRYAGPADTIWRLTGIEAIDLSGPIAIGADVGGTLAAPAIKGSVKTSAGRLESAVTGTVIQGLTVSGRFGGSQLLVDHFTGGTPGGGTVAGSAHFDFGATHKLGFGIDLNATDALLLNAQDIGATVTGPLAIRSDGNGGTISGNVKLMKSRFRLGQAAAAAVPRLAVTEINRGDDVEDQIAPAPWKLDLHARAGNRIAVSGLGLDSEWRATLAIAGTTYEPRITGEADLVRGGYQFAGRRFDLSRGVIRFGGESPPDPALDITAEADITGLSATIRVTGTGQHPDIAFQSIPALPEDDLLARLLFGTSITNLSAPEALQLAAAVASLRGGGNGLDPINAVRKFAGLDRLRILPADVTTGQRTSVAAGKYITRRIYVEVATDGQGYSATRVEWELTRWLSLLSSISTLGRTTADVRISKDY